MLKFAGRDARGPGGLGGAGGAEHERQRAHGSGERHPLRIGGGQLKRHRLDYGWRFGPIVGQLVDPQHAYVLQNDVGERF